MWERNSSYYCMENGSDSSISPRAMKEKKNKRRFSDEQIKSLETMFDSESKLEPRRKMQLARELGLQPRQIAIWFQNRRARCKTKQLEREYSVLRSNYDTLVSSFESLKQEKQTLLKQLQKLRDLIEKPRGSSSDSEYGEEKTHYKEKPKSLLEQGSDSREVVCSDGEDSKNTGYCEKPEPLSMAEVELVCGSLEFPEKLSDLDNSCYVDQSSSSSLQWWELWP